MSGLIIHLVIFVHLIKALIISLLIRGQQITVSSWAGFPCVFFNTKAQSIGTPPRVNTHLFTHTFQPTSLDWDQKGWQLSVSRMDY